MTFTKQLNSAINKIGFCLRKFKTTIFAKKIHYLCKKIYMLRKIDGIRRSKYWYDYNRNK